MKNFTNFLTLVFVIFVLTATACSGQIAKEQNRQASLINKNKTVGGGCDGCELMYVGMPTDIEPVGYSPGWTLKGRKLLITGTVYKLDGKTPAPNVVVYYWQTDDKGYYPTREGMDKKAERHGYIRGWVKTDAEGKYSIYTVRPAPYPNEDMPAHIHTSIKEPTVGNEYYIDEFVFDDDKLLTGAKRKKLEKRGGSGVLRVLISGEMQVAEHNIILGLNIPDYPETLPTGKQSGLQIGEDNPSFIPFHAWGPDKGTRACPVCRYGRYHGIIYLVGNNPNWDEIKKWLTFLEQESVKRNERLKTYFVYGNEIGYNNDKRQKELEQIGAELNLKNVALTFVPSMSDAESEVNLNKVNPNVENTIIILKQRNIVAKFIDLKPSADNLQIVSTTLDKSTGDYFNLLEPEHQ